MTDIIDRVKTALAERYQIEREIGEGGKTVYLHLAPPISPPHLIP